MRQSIASFIALLFLSSTALAQAPQLLVKNPDNPAEKPHPITLAKADVNLLLAGQLCQTTMTLTFTNDANRVLEGELVFPLPENATVSGYALDVNGRLVDAVVVEKEKARAIFETEVRKGIDPGLIEQVKGNNFRTRVYPIPAHGSRTIRVQYVSQPSVKNDQLLYPLPLHWPGSSPTISLRIESVSKQAPTVPVIADLKFKSEGDRHIAEIQMKDASFAGDLAVVLPAASAAQSIVEKQTRSTVSIENLDPKTADQFIKTDYYFVLTDRQTDFAQSTPRPKPIRIAIAWDASLSRASADHTKEFELIKAHLASLQDAKVEIIPFRNSPESPKTFAVENGDSSAIIQYLSALAYDGGTNLGAFDFTSLTSEDRKHLRKDTPRLISYYLLFTDGLTNLGPDLPAKIEVPVYAVSNDAGANHALLRRLSSESSGQYINLQSLTTAQAQEALSSQPFSLLSIECDPKEITDIYPRLPQPVQGQVMLAGRLLAKSAKLTLNYGRGSEITRRVPITLTQDNAGDANLVSRYWAQLKVADLSINVDANQNQITALGKQFNLVTPFTSMLVLETVEQYLQHQIIPPKTQPDLYNEFMKRIEQNHAVAQKEEKAKIDRIVAMWNARLAWWNQDFKYAADFKYKPESPKDGGGGGGLFGGGGGNGGGEPAARTGRGEVAGRHVEGHDAIRQDAARASERPASGTPEPAPQARANAPAQLREREGQVNQSTSLGVGSGDRGRPAETAPAGAATGGQGQTRAYHVEDLAAEVPSFSAGGRSPATRPQTPSLELRRKAAIEGSRNLEATLDGTQITIKPWSPDSPYLKALQAAPDDQAYNVYLKERKSNESSPAFYLDCADFFAKNHPELALRILTNIPELALDDGRLLRIAAHRLQQLGQLDLAIDLFEKVARLRPQEPQSFRDLALALSDRAEQRLAVLDIRDFPIEAARPAFADYQRALELLHKVVMNQWERFDEIEVIALTEANRIIAKMNAYSQALRTANPFDPRLIKLLDPDLRIIMTWDTDNTDIDLHVTEPTGETCVYNHNRTTIGGALSRDFTQGYGPEEYMLKKLVPGQYKIQAHFYGSRDQKLIGPTTVQATIITHYGRPDEKRQSITLRLKEAKDMVDIGTVTLK